ncbi:SLAM family member 5-like isoform 1-T2 [Mantella aurantiaca]
MIGGAELLCMSLYFCMTGANRDNIVPVIGLLHQFVELPSNLSLPSVQEINWNFDRNVTSNKIAHFENLHTKLYNNQFNGRLKLLHNGTTLQIKDLRIEDSGQYTARYIFATGRVDHLARFMLMVYEPVPDPSVMIALEERTSHRCNVTLYCSVPTNSSPLAYRWIYGHPDSIYELRGDTIHILLNNSLEMEFQCIVENPADRNNVSKRARCSAADGIAVKRWPYAILISLLLILFILFLVIWKIRRKVSSKVTEVIDHVQMTANDREHHNLSAEEEEHSTGQIQQASDIMYCEPTFPTINPTTQNFAWHERDSHVNPPAQKFKTLYTSFQRK